jgi:hypothetical protein
MAIPWVRSSMISSAVLAAVGYNFHLLLRRFAALLGALNHTLLFIDPLPFAP